MMETATGILNAAAIARAPRMAGLVLGTNDLAKELTCRTRADREPLLLSLQMCLLAARAAGIACIDVGTGSRLDNVRQPVAVIVEITDIPLSIAIGVRLRGIGGFPAIVPRVGNAIRIGIGAHVGRSLEGGLLRSAVSLQIALT